jgi:hypothetical protein
MWRNKKVDSKKRILETINHREPDKLAIDFGSTPVTGMHVKIVYELRQYYGLDKPETPVKVIEPYQMLGEIGNDLKDILGTDVVGLEGKGTFFGYQKENWKEWKLFDGTPVLVPGLFNTEINKDGSLFQYAKGDKSYPPSAKMPKGGYFIDSLKRQKIINDDQMDPNDNLEEFNILSDDNIEYFNKELIRINPENYHATTGMIASSSFGDIAFVPGPMLKDPKGIRDIEEWYISTQTRKKYIKDVFSGQLEIALENYRKVNEAIGSLIDVVFVTGTDFGTQQGLFSSIDTYRELFKPFHKRINNWIHENTNWKTFIHTCGAVYKLIPDLVEAGFDILNPVQINALEMNPKKLKSEFGRHITFWGGGIDTQETLAFGTPEDVKKQIVKLIEIFFPGGGFVFNTVHNIQANVPIKNIIAMIEVLQEYRK